ncbi:MAG: hypothetical protein V1837_03390 [Candidatus Woesearchaeota archaeon]
MNEREYIRSKLAKFRKDDIIFTEHTEIRLLQRQLKREEIIENIINPSRLEYAIREEAKSLHEEKFDCYFGYSKTRCHRYVLAVNKKVIVVTAVKINRKWQRIAEKKLKSIRTLRRK